MFYAYLSFVILKNCFRQISYARLIPISISLFGSLSIIMIAELQRASEAPWVRKIGNPSSRENLVMTSAYDRPTERANLVPRVSLLCLPWSLVVLPTTKGGREERSWERGCERASERTSVQTRGDGEGRLEIFLTVTQMGNSFLRSFLF